MKAYDRRPGEESLKVYRDNKNTMDYTIETAKKEGRQEGILEGASKRETEIARELKRNGVSVNMIEKTTGLTKEQIEKL